MDIPIPKKALIGRIGGKSNLANRLISLFPPNYEDLTYVEPFVGGGSIFFRKQPSRKEIINDLDKEMYSIYKKVKQQNINDVISRTPKTKKYFDEVLKPTKDPVKLIEKYKRSFFSQGKSYNENKSKNTIKTDFSVFTDRLKKVKIFNKDFRYIINKFDSPETFFYLDPPYSVENEKDNPYSNYITPTDVFNAVKNIDGYFMLSYNNTKEIRDLFKDYKIKKIKTTYSGTGSIEPRTITELVITNY
jgi:DNA adenine methylase